MGCMVVEVADGCLKRFGVYLFESRRILFRTYIIQSLAFKEGRDMRNNLVFSTHPRTVLISSGVPLPFNFGMLVAFARGIVGRYC